MKDDRLRMTLDDPYAAALGRAVFAFARLEWDAAWCCNKLEPGYIDNLSKKTAGNIAADLMRLASANQALWDVYEASCNEFKRLVVVRNELLHGKPGATDPESDQRLFKQGVAWAIELVDDAADDFTACQIQLNDMLFKGLHHV